MMIIVDTLKWYQNTNRGPPRAQSIKCQQEIKSQIDAMLYNRIIKKSQANYYSQVLLTPKPNGAMRFCIDYKKHNEASNKGSWPLPKYRTDVE